MDKIDPDKKGILFVIIIFSVLISIIAYWAIDSSNLVIIPMDTRELTITKLDFTVGDASTGKIIIQAINAGSKDIEVSKIKVNNETATSWEGTNSATVTAGGSETITVTHEITAGTKYTITFFEKTNGQMVCSYTKTSPRAPNSDLF